MHLNLYSRFIANISVLLRCARLGCGRKWFFPPGLKDRKGIEFFLGKLLHGLPKVLGLRWDLTEVPGKDRCCMVNLFLFLPALHSDFFRR